MYTTVIGWFNTHTASTHRWDPWWTLHTCGGAPCWQLLALTQPCLPSQQFHCSTLFINADKHVHQAGHFVLQRICQSNHCHGKQCCCHGNTRFHLSEYMIYGLTGYHLQWSISDYFILHMLCYILSDLGILHQMVSMATMLFLWLQHFVYMQDSFSTLATTLITKGFAFLEHSNRCLVVTMECQLLLWQPGTTATRQECW